MKKVLFLAALVLGVVSCQKDFTADNESRGEVSVQLSVAAPELVGATRTDGDAQKNLNSAYGAIDYLDGAPVGDYREDWSNVDLRYSMEVYEEDDLVNPVKDRVVIIKDKYEPVTFELRLIPNRNYRFVVFADFVPEGTAAQAVDYANQAELGLRHTIGETLSQITIKQDVDAINDEIADAYFKSFTYTPSNNTTNKADDVILQRPYAKLRVIATDLADLNLTANPKYVTVTYGNNVVIPTTFNAVEGTISDTKNESDKTFEYTYVDNIRTNRVNHVYNCGYDDDVAVAANGVERASHLTLFTDYILATDSQSPVSFQMTVYDQDNEPIKTVDFNTNIPTQRNHLTTIIGNLMTAYTEFSVTIDDNFANADDVEKEPWYMEIWDGKSQTEPEVTVDQNGETVAIIDQPSDLAWLAAYVNGTLETPSTFATRAAQQINFVLAANIDLGNQPWTPIGTEENNFVGTFDGNGYSISNLNIVEAEAKEGKAYMGFFGYAKNATIKNVVFQNVYVNIPCLDIDHSQGHIGAVVGSLEGTSTIENVTVKGDVKVETTLEANGASRVAVVAGGNTYGNVTMKNVHVVANEGSYLVANNNVGALAGQLQGVSVFENCSSNIDVTAYKFFAGGIIGLAAGDQKFTNCHTTGDVKVIAGRAGRANDHYRVGGIAGGWADNKKTPCVLTSCSYTGEVSGVNADGSVAEVLDYAGYVGRGYTLSNMAGSTVIIDGAKYVQIYDNVYGEYYYTGAVVEVAGVKAVVLQVEDGFVAVSVEEKNLKGMNATDAAAWAEGLGEGWNLASIYELDAIHAARKALNKGLAADNAENALFCETEYYADGKYAIYVSSTDAEGNDPQGAAYFANRVHLKYFNLNGYWDYNYSTFATISKYAPLKDYYFARAVYAL